MASFEEKLIDLVRENDCIYNIKSKMHKNTLRKDQSWTEIATELDRPMEECKQRWRSLRDRYVREKRKAASEGAAGDGGAWQYMPLLSFLEDAALPRKRVENSDAASTSVVDSNYDELVVYEFEPEPVPQAPSVASTPNNRKRPRNESPLNDFLGQLTNTIKSRFAERSENQVFMMSMAKKIDLMPKRTQLRLQGQILTMVNDELLNSTSSELCYKDEENDETQISVAATVDCIKQEVDPSSSPILERSPTEAAYNIVLSPIMPHNDSTNKLSDTFTPNNAPNHQESVMNPLRGIDAAEIQAPSVCTQTLLCKCICASASAGTGNNTRISPDLSKKTILSDDSLELFFNSICASVKQLPPILAIEGKKRMMEIVTGLEMRALSEYNQ